MIIFVYCELLVILFLFVSFLLIMFLIRATCWVHRLFDLHNLRQGGDTGPVRLEYNMLEAKDHSDFLNSVLHNAVKFS